MNIAALKTVQAPPIGRRALKDMVTTGRIASPIKALIYADEGVGKSTFAAGAPKPIFVSFDNRTNHLDVARLKPKSWDETLSAIHLIEREGQEYATVVLDPLGWLETFCHTKVTGDPTVGIDSFDGGYGRGANAALAHWRILIDALDRLWEQGKNILLVAHTEVKSFDDPRGPKFDRYQVSMKQSAAGRFRQWADYVIFAEIETIAKKASANGSMKGVSTERRIAHLKPHGAYNAKFSGSGPAQIDLSWRAFEEAITASPKKAQALRDRIFAIAAEIGDDVVTAKLKGFVAEAKDDSDRLEEIANSAATKLAEVQATKTETDQTKKEG